MRVGPTMVRDGGWLAFEYTKLTSLSDTITARPNQHHKLSAQVNGHQVNGQLNSANGGRFFTKYSNGTIVTVWRNTGSFRASQNVTGSFTTPTGVTCFQIGTGVVLAFLH